MSVRNNIENLTQIFPAQAVSSVNQTNNQIAAQATSQNESAGSDRAQISVVATEASNATGASDIRLDKIAGVQEALQAGTYEVSPADLAKKLVSSMLANEE